MKKYFRIILSVLLCGSVVSLSNLANAATFTVTTTSDNDCSDNNCTLAAALLVADSNGEDDTVNIEAGEFNVSVAEAAVYIGDAAEDNDLTITGAGSSLTTLNASSANQGLVIDTNTQTSDANTLITVSGFTIINGVGTAIVGGGLSIEATEADVVVQETAFTGNVSDSGAGGLLIDISGAGTLTFSNNIVLGNEASVASEGGGARIHLISGSATLADNQFITNTSEGAGGGLDLTTTTGAIALNNNTFQGNRSGSTGGGLVASTSGSGNFTANGNTFTANQASNSGGGMRVSLTGSGDMVFVNNIFTNNYSDVFGGAGSVNVTTGDMTFTNNTFYFNTAPSIGAALFLRIENNDALGNFYNNIFYSNQSAGDGTDIYLDDDDGDATGSVVTISNNDVNDIYTLCADTPGCTSRVTQSNNIDLDPDFVDASIGNFYLLTGSPAIATGDPAAPSIPTTDHDGNATVTGTTVDMGALAYSATRVSAAPTLTDFGEVTVATSESVTITITNSGGEAVQFTGMVLSDTTDYTLDPGSGGTACGSTTLSLAAGGSCTLTVTFTPTTASLLASTLSLSSNSLSNPLIVVQLVGTGSSSASASTSSCAFMAGAPSSQTWTSFVGIISGLFILFAVSRKKRFNI